MMYYTEEGMMHYTEEELFVMVDMWHDGAGRNFDSLHEWLGWTREQYTHWVETGEQP